VRADVKRGYRTPAAFLLVVAILAVPAAWAAADTPPGLELKEELARIEGLLAGGASLSDAEVAATEQIVERAQEEGTRSLRTRSTLVAYLARETRAYTVAAARAGERSRVAVADERSRGHQASIGRARLIVFRVSLGVCAVSLGAFNAFGLLAEDASSRSASAQAVSYGIAAASSAGAFVAGLVALLATAGAALTSPR
jgi:hypothetical protein